MCLLITVPKLSWTQSTMVISWTALDMTGVDPDIWYSVVIYNVTDENNPTASSVLTISIAITETHYTFTPDYIPQSLPCVQLLCHPSYFNGFGQVAMNMTFVNVSPFLSFMLSYRLLTLGAHALEGYILLSFRPSFLPSVCLLPRFLPLRATRRPKSDTNGFSVALASFQRYQKLQRRACIAFACYQVV